METHQLVKMANNIGAFFKSEPDFDLAVAGVEQHLKNFWEPRMREAIINYQQQDGSELMDIVAKAVQKLAANPQNIAATYPFKPAMKFINPAFWNKSFTLSPS